MSLLFIPLSPAELADWAGGGRLDWPRPGFSAAPGLRYAFETDDEEDAEHIALLVASVAGLARYGLRLVAVVEASGESAGDPDFGELRVSETPYSAVQAIFAEDDLPAGQEHFLTLNAELAKQWPVITTKKDAPPDAADWDGKPDKLPYLER